MGGNYDDFRDALQGPANKIQKDLKRIGDELDRLRDNALIYSKESNSLFSVTMRDAKYIQVVSQNAVEILVDYFLELFAEVVGAVRKGDLTAIDMCGA